MILVENVGQYKGKTLSHFEDENGKEINKIHMVDSLVIVFSDKTRIKIGIDQRWNESFLSQYKN